MVARGDVRRVEREWETMVNMVEIYCSGNHDCSPLCSECDELLQYAKVRLDRCPNAEDKPTCNMCPVHCYDAPHRDRIKTVMRYAGPRMIFRHPMQALRHIVDEMNSPPKKT
jgi:hypothetical protein